MEKGYFHPNLGYWQTNVEPSPEILATYPSGTVEVPLQPGEWYVWDGSAWVFNPPAPTNASVNRERDRRVLLGKTFEVPGIGGVRIGGDDTTVRNLQGLAFAAQMRLAQGDTTTITMFRDEDNVIHDLLPAQVISLWSQGAAFVSACFAAAWALKDNTAGIPADYQDDTYWP